MVLLLGIVGFLGYHAWREDREPKRNFERYFGTRPTDAASRRTALPKVVDRLYELHAKLPEQELKELEKQIADAAARMDVSVENRDIYFRLLGRRDQAWRKSASDYRAFNNACDAAWSVLGGHGEEIITSTIALTPCPSGYGGGLF
jgi:hypothetical protein